MADSRGLELDLADPELVAAFDELTYWSSMFGQLLFRHLELVPGLAVLDVGCGTGFPLFELADRLGPTSTVHGIDACEQAVERARRKARVRGATHVRVTHGDAAGMPCEDESFDLIVSNVGLNNFEEAETVMGECRRVCKRGGRLALTTILVGQMVVLYEVFEAVLVDLGLADRVDALHEHVVHRASLEGLRALFAGAGFELTACHADSFTLRYADSGALLRATLTRLGFPPSRWFFLVEGLTVEPVDLRGRIDQAGRRDRQDARDRRTAGSSAGGPARVALAPMTDEGAAAAADQLADHRSALLMAPAKPIPPHPTA